MIPVVLRIAVRNVTRHRRRSAICLAAIAFGIVALLMSQGFIEWVLWAHRETTIRSHLGHIQISRQGYHEEGASNPFGFLLREDAPIRTAVSKLPGVETVASRIEFSGLIARGETTTSFIGEGIEPERERLITSSLTIVDGANLSGSDPQGVVLGEGLAANLGVKVSDTVVLIGKTASGGINAVECKVRGTFRTITKAYDDSALRAPIGTVRRLLRSEGSHLWVLLLDRTEQTDSVLASVRGQAAGDAGLEIVPWYKLADFYTKTATLFAKQVLVVQIIIAVIVGLSILNSMTMVVMERTSEIGTCMATGTRRSRILQQFLGEGAVMGLLGGLLGVAIAYPLAHVISAIGIPMPPPPGQSWGYLGQIRISPKMVFDTLALVVFTSLAASVFPAWKASRLNIVDALRQSR